MIDPPSSTAQHYEIRIKGHLDDRWAEWFEGLTITLEEDGDTLLSGPVIDQAALYGLLKKVRDSGMPLVSFNQLPPQGNLQTNLFRSKKMNTYNQPISEIPAKLSTLWIFVTFNIAFADIIGFIEPGTLERIINGDTGFEITPALIVIFSLLQAIPIAMIVVSRWFRRGVNRWLNIGASVLTLAYVLGGGNWESTSYFVFVSLEVVAMLGIIWLVWNWRNVETQPIQQ
jgi:hypothetical protein